MRAMSDRTGRPPWLAAVIIVAIALAIVAPVRLSLSIGDRSDRRKRYSLVTFWRLCGREH
jgi:hypothetical protein